jgi:hypothetical protein
MRHSFVTNALENGLGVAQVAELLGYTSADMVMQSSESGTRHNPPRVWRDPDSPGVQRHGPAVSTRSTAGLWIWERGFRTDPCCFVDVSSISSIASVSSTG